MLVNLILSMNILATLSRLTRLHVLVERPRDLDVAMLARVDVDDAVSPVAVRGVGGAPVGGRAGIIAERGESF